MSGIGIATPKKRPRTTVGAVVDAGARQSPFVARLKRAVARTVVAARLRNYPLPSKRAKP